MVESGEQRPAVRTLVCPNCRMPMRYEATEPDGHTIVCAMFSSSAVVAWQAIRWLLTSVASPSSELCQDKKSERSRLAGVLGTAGGSPWRTHAHARRYCTPLRSPNGHSNAILLDDGGEAGVVFQQALAAETQEIISEVRVLEAQFQELVVGDGEHLAVLGALHRLGPAVVGGEKSKLPDHAPGAELDPDLAD